MEELKEIDIEEAETPALLPRFQPILVNQEDDIINDSTTVPFSSKSFFQKVITKEVPLKNLPKNLPIKSMESMESMETSESTKQTQNKLAFEDSNNHSMITQANFSIPAKTIKTQPITFVNTVMDSEPFPLTQPSTVPLKERLQKQSPLTTRLNAIKKQTQFLREKRNREKKIEKPSKKLAKKSSKIQSIKERESKKNETDCFDNEWEDRWQ